MSVTITVSDDGHVEAMHNSGRVLYDFTIDTDSDSVTLADDLLCGDLATIGRHDLPDRGDAGGSRWFLMRIYLIWIPAKHVWR
ncbi:hypothetical protein BV210_05945 [Halorientalis sp. IM1011]|uniref:hypothetical protein n=1 Tax=Halorientalis sp. IM1011 TaxID=1932360 RepID=UPI00097CC43A|nr:hypothetical protein [Halorientalis sp. IM1011]AQL42282.1 hypothetical protein BV210_05945 [Halorientalis sp. IM1011]